ncbi:MAG: low molecular weight protein-tyrosine-phosphatase [Bacteroidales bacterium]
MNRTEKTEKYKILFVCLGNICRSPTAEGVMQTLVKEAHLDGQIGIDSAGTYGGHAGELPDARMRQHAQRRGYALTSRSRQVRVSDFEEFDLIVAMDDRNYEELRHLAPDLEAQAKVHRMVEYSTQREYDYIPDPYYGGAEGFELVIDLLEEACGGLLNEIKTKIL